MAEKLATILNVNDHEQTRYLVGRMLRQAGYEVLEAGTGEDALRLASVKQPDLIVLDVKLPDFSGFEVARMVKSRKETSSIIVLQTSATFVTIDKKVEGLESGADSYLTHPFEPAELLATVKALLRLRRAEQDLQRRADDLQEADRRKDEFLAMLAHELRNPLAAISTATSLIDTYRHDELRFRQVRGVLERQTKHLARLVDDLLDVARITRNRIELQREPVDLAPLLAETVDLVRPLFLSRGQTLEVHVEDERLRVRGDATRLQQIVSNLLDNASKYSDKGGRIEVTLRRLEHEGASLGVFKVKDAGMGIAPNVLPHVFELFVQADESLERARGGMGIGLTLVKRLVEMHGGKVKAASEGLGKGAEFEVRLPLIDSHGAARPARPTPSVALTTGKVPRRILIVEDNQDARDTLQAFLEVEGHQVSTAPDGVRGLELALSGNFELAIVDVGLPGLNGFEVAERVRASHRMEKLHLVALTGYGGSEQRVRAIKAGFDLHLVKPVDLETLLQVIGDLPR